MRRATCFACRCVNVLLYIRLDWTSGDMHSGVWFFMYSRCIFKDVDGTEIGAERHFRPREETSGVKIMRRVMPADGIHFLARGGAQPEALNSTAGTRVTFLHLCWCLRRARHADEIWSGQVCSLFSPNYTQVLDGEKRPDEFVG